ncbi:MAG: hypothetical protein L0Y56_06150 [Nitrospira sp.]|nr:hypothetical protein [Nitrospira sp.]
MKRIQHIPHLPRKARKISEKMEKAKAKAVALLEAAGVQITGGIGFGQRTDGAETLVVSVQIGHAEDAKEALAGLGVPLRIREAMPPRALRSR